MSWCQGHRRGASWSIPGRVSPDAAEERALSGHQVWSWFLFDRLPFPFHILAKRKRAQGQTPRSPACRIHRSRFLRPYKPLEAPRATYHRRARRRLVRAGSRRSDERN